MRYIKDGSATLLSDKIDFKSRILLETKEAYFIMTKGLTDQED